MKAAQINNYGNVIELKDIPTPIPEKGQVLVEVKASSINPADIKIQQGHMKVSQLPATLGIDVAGIVKEVGDGVSQFKVGDKVFGQANPLTGGSGAFAEFAVTNASSIALMPDNINFTEAASMPLTGVSAIQALMDHMNLKSGQRILIHGGAGGIGTTAIQIAKNIGAYVATTVSQHDIDFVRKLGADEVIDYKRENFEDKIKDYDAVFDCVGGETYKRSFKVLKQGGTIVSMLEEPNRQLMTQYGVTAILEMTNVNTGHLNTLAKLIKQMIVTIHIDETYSLDDIQNAFMAKQNESIQGKIAVEI